MKFGDYVRIEQKRYGDENEMYEHKVIGCLKSNYYVDVPVENCIETFHPEVIDVVACICCGVDERVVYRYKKSDVIFKRGE